MTQQLMIECLEQVPVKNIKFNNRQIKNFSDQNNIAALLASSVAHLA